MTFYSRREETLNVWTHGIGILLSVTALVLLIVRASLNGSAWHVVSFCIFGTSLIVLYTASTIYHSAKNPVVRKRLEVFDHAAIFALIAGTYTPFTLVTLNGVVGWVIFGITWGVALAGIILKLFFTGRFNLLSTIMYVMMGWIIIFAIKPLVNNLELAGLWWLFAGGLAYTLGAVIYSIRIIPFNHAIFHGFVMLGSIFHFFTVYFFVLPKS